MDGVCLPVLAVAGGWAAGFGYLTCCVVWFAPVLLHLRNLWCQSECCHWGKSIPGSGFLAVMLCYNDISSLGSNASCLAVVLLAALLCCFGSRATFLTAMLLAW
jgi:hypothetical protein